MQVWPAILACAALNAFVLIQIGVHNPNYLADYRVNDNPDAKHYVLLGHNIFVKGAFSRCSSPPYVPDILRTPIYPLFAGGLDLMFGSVGIYIGHALLHIASCVLLFHLVNTYFGTTAAAVAAFFLATDLVLAVSNYDAMSEMVYVFLTIASLTCLLPVLSSQFSGHPNTARIALGALLLGMATLTRPVGLYVPAIIVVVLLILGYTTCQKKQILRTILILLLVYSIPVGSWIARNYVQFSVPHLSNNDAIMIVYFAGAGAYQVEHGISLEEAQERISREFDIPNPHITNNHWLTDLPIAEVDERVRSAKWSVLKQYPASLLASSVIGIAKSSVSHNVHSFASKTNREWVAPGTGSLLRMERTALSRLLKNDSLLVGAFLWQVFHIGLILLLAFCGFLMLAKRALSGGDFGVILVLALLLGYFFLTVALVGMDAYYRSRFPHTPILCIYAAMAVSAVLKPIFPPINLPTGADCER